MEELHTVCVAVHHAWSTSGALSDLIVFEPFALADISSLPPLPWSDPLLLLGNVPVSLVHHLLLKLCVFTAPELFFKYDPCCIAAESRLV